MPTAKPSKRKKKKAKAWNFTYPDEVIQKYRKMSVRQKLEWLEEVNRITFLALSEKEKKFREKIRQGR